MGELEARALTVRQPYAWAIVHAGKTPENRSWDTKYRGRLYIHAGLTVDREVLAEAQAEGDNPDCVTGAIIGYVDVVGTHHCGDECTGWAFPASWHWELANPVPLPVPVPCRGALGLWKVPDDVAAKLSVGAR
jgi:hypothetical protein